MSSGFISEKELQKQREERQKEWERVRKEDQPLEAPEVVHDNRSLFDKLQDAKNKKQEEWEESRKLKNTIRKLDEDDCSFLDQVDRYKLQHSAEISAEEERELVEFREAQLSTLDGCLIDQSGVSRVSAAAPVVRSTSGDKPYHRSSKTKQSRLMSGVVVKRGNSSSHRQPSTASTNAQSSPEGRSITATSETASATTPSRLSAGDYESPPMKKPCLEGASVVSSSLQTAQSKASAVPALSGICDYDSSSCSDHSDTQEPV